MVEYICNRCGYNAKQKNKFNASFKSQNICNPILEDISIEEVKKHYGFIHSTKIHQNPPKLHQNPPNHPPKFPPKNTKIHQNAKFHIHQNPPKSTKIRSY